MVMIKFDDVGNKSPNIDHMLIEIDGETYSEGSTFDIETANTLELVADTGYKFEKPYSFSPYLLKLAFETGATDVADFVYDENTDPAFDDNAWTFTFDIEANRSDIDTADTLLIEANLQEDDTHVQTGYDIVESSLSGSDLSDVDVYAGGDEVFIGDNVSSIDDIQIDTKTGLKFSEIDGNSITITLKNESGEELANRVWSLSDDAFTDNDTTFQVNISDMITDNVKQISFSLFTEPNGSEPEPPKEYTSDFITTFKTDSETLSDLGDVLFTDSQIDIGKFIYKIYSLPFKVDKRLISSEKLPIKIGDIDTGQKAKYIQQNKLKIDFGDIQVTGEYGNVFDFKDTKCYLHAPYLDEPIDIEPSYVIDKDINVFYTVDLYTGTTTLYIHSYELDSVFKRQEIEAVREIPFHTEQNGFTQKDIDAYKYNDMITPFIEVVRNRPYSKGKDFGKNVIETGKLQEYNGYVEVDNIDLKSRATSTEHDNIVSMLNSGIYIQ